MPQHAFLCDALVHLTNPWCNIVALCGESAVPYGIQLHSTDEALAYARTLAGLRYEVSCFHCIALDFAYPHGFAVGW